MVFFEICFEKLSLIQIDPFSIWVKYFFQNFLHYWFEDDDAEISTAEKFKCGIIVCVNYRNNFYFPNFNFKFCHFDLNFIINAQFEFNNPVVWFKTCSPIPLKTLWPSEHESCWMVTNGLPNTSLVKLLGVKLWTLNIKSLHLHFLLRWNYCYCTLSNGVYKY